jgi:hypothetical protein
MTHLVSGVDPDPRPALGHCGSATFLSGYTEWVSTRSPTISIGWDWCLQPGPDGATWSRVGLPSSNVMLTVGREHDAGWSKNQDLLATVVDALPWQEYLPTAVAARYA